MRHFYLFLLCTFLSLSLCLAQTNSSVVNKEKLGNFILEDSAKATLVFTYKATFDANGIFTLLVTNSSLKPAFSETFTLVDFDKDLFTSSFKKLFTAQKNIKSEGLQEKALELFYKVKGQIEVLDDSPNTASLKLVTSQLILKITKSTKGSKNAKTEGKEKPINTDTTIKVNVERVDIEFEDGTIKNLILSVKPTDTIGRDRLEDGIIRFRNSFPLGISGKFSPQKLRNNSLMFAYDPYRAEQVLNHHIIQPTYSVVQFDLADLIDYRIILEVNKEDYSPANQVITLTPLKNEVILKKSLRSQILEIRTYTDLIGLDGSQPNGLIQIEARKKIFVIENKIKSFKTSYIGCLVYFEPVLRFSKLENTNRNLMPDSAGSGANLKSSNKKILNVNTIDLYKYQQQTLFFNLNLLQFGFPQGKVNFMMDAKFGLYRTGITDSLAVSSGKIIKIDKSSTTVVNTALYGVNFLFNFLPDSRYGLSAGYSILQNRMLNSNYIQNQSGRLYSYWLDGNFKTTESSTIFVRGSFYTQYKDKNQNFAQAQLGVSFNLFKPNAK